MSYVPNDYRKKILQFIYPLPPNLFLFIIRARQISPTRTHTQTRTHTTPTHVASGKVVLRVITSSLAHIHDIFSLRVHMLHTAAV